MRSAADPASIVSQAGVDRLTRSNGQADPAVTNDDLRDDQRAETGIIDQAIVQQKSFLEARPNTPRGRIILAKLHRSLAETLRQMGEQPLAAQVEEQAERIFAERDVRQRHP